jgi:FkbM family methyltransferase
MNNNLIDEARKLGIEIPKFFLIDVGVSGGIPEQFRKWDDQLHGVGFDPIVSEIDTLNRKEEGNFKYFNYFVTSKENNKEISTKDEKSNYQIRRTSAWVATDLLKKNNSIIKKNYNQKDIVNYLKNIPESPLTSTFENDDKLENDPFIGFYKKIYSNNKESKISKNEISLDEFLENKKIEKCDFLKIDTDGHELSVLRGAKETLKHRQTMGVYVECQFHGPENGFDGNFSDIDKFLREEGFSLYKLETYNYSKAALPSPFAIKKLPAQTIKGQIQWANALYLRDLGDKNYKNKYEFELNKKNILNQIFLLDIYELYDCAAELIIIYLINNINSNNENDKYFELLNHLSLKSEGEKNYSDYMLKWFNNPLHNN